MLYGFDMGGSKIEIAVFNDQLESVWQKRVVTPQNSYQSLLQSFVQLTQEADEKFNTKGKIGIGLAGIPNPKLGTVFTTNIPETKHKPLLSDLENVLGRPIKIENDANCFALSEVYTPDRRHYSSVLGIILGTGLGAGLVINGKPYSGFNGIAGEIGHLRLPVDCLEILGLDTPLVKCGCGQYGCAERYLSGTGFQWLYQYMYQQPLLAPQIISLYYQKDQNAVAHVNLYLTLLAAYLGNICTLLDPELIVLGGGLSNFDEIYQKVPALLQNYIFHVAQAPAIEKARFGDSGGVRGAAFLNIY